MLINEKSKVIGWVGIDKYDLVLYLSLILSSMNKKVLLIDQSETKALSYCIPIPSSLNPKKDKITYRNIDFVNGMNIEDFNGKYDFILIDFGFKVNHNDLKYCNKIFIVTDRQQHNIDRICTLSAKTGDVFLIWRNLRNRRVTALKEIITQKIEIKNHYILDYDDIDNEKMIALQYSNEIQFKKLSAQYKYLLHQIITEILNINGNELGQAFKRLKRGA